METYWDSYEKRMKRTEELLFHFAEKLKENGFKVYRYPGDRYLHGYTIRKNGKHITLYFCEAPYRWELGIQWRPNKKTGSGKTIKEHFDIDKIPFTVSEIEQLMYQDFPGQWKNTMLTEI